LLAAAREAFTAELHAVAAVSAAVLAGIAVLIVTTLRNVRPIGQGGPEGVHKPCVRHPFCLIDRWPFCIIPAR
jgi:hypothetical protein